MYASSAVVKLSPGENVIEIKAENRLGESTVETIRVTFNPPAPGLTLGYVPETTNNDSFALTWTVSDPNDDSPKVYINDELVYGSSYRLSCPRVKKRGISKGHPNHSEDSMKIAHSRFFRERAILSF